MKLEGRVAIVTGGSRGIGRAIVCALAREGAKVAFAYHSKREAADELVAELVKEGREVVAYQCDVKSKSAADNLVDINSLSRVADASLNAPPGICDFASRGFQGSLVNICYDDMRTFVGQSRPDGLADAVSTTDNNSYLVQKAIGLS